MNVSAAAGELEIAVTAGMQNRGCGTEAIRALSDCEKRQLGLERIWFRTRPENARAVHVYKKCGFRAYDRSEDHLFMELL